MLADGSAQPHVFKPGDDESSFIERTVTVSSQSGRISAHVVGTSGGMYKDRYGYIEFDVGECGNVDLISVDQ